MGKRIFVNKKCVNLKKTSAKLSYYTKLIFKRISENLTKY